MIFSKRSEIFFKIMLSACNYAAPWRMMGRGNPVLELEITREPARSANQENMGATLEFRRNSMANSRKPATLGQGFRPRRTGFPIQTRSMKTAKPHGGSGRATSATDPAPDFLSTSTALPGWARTLAEQPAEERFEGHVIKIRGAREHNLKNIDLTIPRGKLVVFTGLSGSGKSSLAFDTIYAEGQRRYVESLSAYARQFLEMMQKPDVDQIDGLSPAISIEQKTTSKNPRSTVGTVTEIYDYMRLLFARIGIAYSPATGLPIESQTVTQMVDRVMALPRTRFYLIAPVIRGRKGEYRKEIAEFMKRGFQRLKIDGEFYEIADAPQLDKKLKHDIDVVVDRIAVREGIEARLAESFETALELADGIAIAEYADERDENGSPKRIVFSAKFACPVSGFTIPEIEPRLFSFNNPFGACPHCGGLGVEQTVDPELIVPDLKLTLRRGAIAPWARSSSPYYLQTLEALAKHFKFRLDARFETLPQRARDVILHGSGEEAVRFTYEDGLRSYDVVKPFEGIIGNLERRYHETESEWAREDISRYMTASPCGVCEGARLRPEALAVKIEGCHISQLTTLSVGAAQEWFGALAGKLDSKRREIAKRILKELSDRLSFLIDVGLDYLTLSRASGTLSGGESQRIRLASQIGSGLSGVLYVLDEPSIGLHQRDNARLLDTLRRLRDLGNTVIVVEHDEDAILAADHVVDFGPGAGIRGGEIVARGTAAEIMANKDSLTGQYLTGALEVAAPRRRRRPASSPSSAPTAIISKISRPRSRSGFSPASPASPAAANRPSLSIRSTKPPQGGSTARSNIRRRIRESMGSNISTRSSTSTNRRSGARRARIRRLILAPSRRSGNGSRPSRKPRRAVIRLDASLSTSRGDAARPARATG
jgi:excinuclease ABC subunit A